VTKILITGMSGTGKSSVISELADRGYHAVDTDNDFWSEWRTDDAGQQDWVWREDRIRHLLESAVEPLVVGGCKSNQEKFYPLLDYAVLLAAPLDLLLYRVVHRTNTDYGKTSFDQFMIRENVESVEPLLRNSSDAIFDTARVGIDEVADAIESFLVGESLPCTQLKPVDCEHARCTPE
jgi:shikimate kinase